MLSEFPAQHLSPVFVAESASHEHIPPVHCEQLEHGEEAFPPTVRSQDHGRLDALQTLSAAGISGQALEVSADLLCSTRRKVAADPVSQPLGQLGHIVIIPAPGRSVVRARSIAGNVAHQVEPGLASGNA
jgi:hypothetical protein